MLSLIPAFSAYKVITLNSLKKNLLAIARRFQVCLLWHKLQGFQVLVAYDLKPTQISKSVSVQDFKALRVAISELYLMV